MFPELSQFPRCGVDTETTGLKWWEDKVFAVTVSTPDGKDYYADMRVSDDRYWVMKEIPRIIKPIFHNAKFDLHFLREAGVKVDGFDRIEDTVVRAALINEHEYSYELDHLAKSKLGVGKIVTIYEELARMFGGPATKAAQMPNLHRAPRALVQKYTCQDSRITLNLFDHQEPEIEKQELGKVLKLECDLIPVLLDMEHRGVRVDVEGTERAAKIMDGRVDKLRLSINKAVGKEFNVNSPKQAIDFFKPKRVYTGEASDPAFFAKMTPEEIKDCKQYRWVMEDGTILNKTDSGGPSFDAEAFGKMKHPVGKEMLELKQIIKLRDTFMRGHILGHHHHGVVHCNYNQTKSDNDLGTGVGRMSINNPALQQIHKRNKVNAAIVRSLFLPDEGQDWSCADWQQMDFRIFAHYAEVPRILKMYQDDPFTDFHQVVADMTGLPRSMTPGIKGNAKQINLGLVFGMGEGTLCQEMGLPYDEMTRGDRTYNMPGEEGVALFKQYHEAVPGIKKVLQQASSIAKSRGYVKTIMDRHIRFPRGQFTHKAGGLVFQGSAADALKVKLVEIHNYLKGTEGRLLLNVHDEFDTSLPKGQTKYDADIKEIVQDFGPTAQIHFNVPILSDMKRGPNWWEACKD